jgi:hypothetical protein
MSSTMEAKLARSATMSTPGIGTAEMPAEIAARLRTSARQRSRTLPMSSPTSASRPSPVSCVFFLKIFLSIAFPGLLS